MTGRKTLNWCSEPSESQRVIIGLGIKYQVIHLLLLLFCFVVGGGFVVVCFVVVVVVFFRGKTPSYLLTVVFCLFVCWRGEGGMLSLATHVSCQCVSGDKRYSEVNHLRKILVMPVDSAV